MAGKPWYNNGIREIQIGPKEIIPEGYVRGRKPMTPEQYQSRTSKYLKSIANKTQEEKDLSNQKRSQSLRKSYSKKSDLEKREMIDKRTRTIQSWSADKKAAYREHLSEGSRGKNKGHQPWNKGLTKDTDDRVNRNALNTSIGTKKYIQEVLKKDPDRYTKWREHINEVTRARKTFNTSKPENDYYKLLVEQFGVDNVVRWYSEERYPFICDFYIKSEDLFIEYNKSWTHGKHSFNANDPVDIDKLNQWKEKSKSSKYYKNAIYTWTDLDIRKQNIAKKNNLNYIVIY